MRKYIGLIVFFIMVAVAGHAEADDYSGVMSYKCFDLKGNQRWSADAVITACPGEGQDIYTLVEQGKDSGEGATSWKIEMKFDAAKDNIRLLGMSKSVFDADGKKIAGEVQRFDYASNAVTSVCEDTPSGKKTEKVFTFEGDNILNRITMGLYIQKLLKNKQTQRKVYFLSSEPNLYRITIKLIGKEKIRINGQEQEVCKLQLDPSLGLLSVAKVFMPKAYMWHYGAPGYKWIKYAGLESGISSPIVEVTTLDEGGR